MEVCGTHTMAAARFGLKSLLPKPVELISGPGCPVYVTDQTDIDALLALGAETGWSIRPWTRWPRPGKARPARGAADLLNTTHQEHQGNKDQKGWGVPQPFNLKRIFISDFLVVLVPWWLFPPAPQGGSEPPPLSV